MNPDLARERVNVQFNHKALTNFIYGGQEKVERRHVIAEFVENTPDFNDPRDPSFMSREERMENVMRKTVAMRKNMNKINLQDEDELDYYRRLIFALDLSAEHLHDLMFIPTVRDQGTDQQRKQWLPLAVSRSILGTYAQTELGHGTNVKKLETTATYDPKSGEFVINSPTLTATKWWPGNLGKTTNHTVLIAQLHTQGRNRGVQAFIVPLRDLKTHEPLPGITIGDIGPKFGIHANDNGYLRLNNVRIPRENMLMKYSQVDADGTYRPPGHQKLAYGSLVLTRSHLVTTHAMMLAQACTIAVRYSCVRRQGEKLEGSGEVQLLDYQTQQYRLFPELTKLFAIYFAGLYVRQLYQQVSEKVQQGQTDQLADLHALSAGLKAVVTRDISLGIEICRLSCGGHGYLLASGLPDLYAKQAAGSTYEGDNIVMLLQTARFLMKLVRSKGNRNRGVAAYIFEQESHAKSQLDQRMRPEDLLDAYQHVARRLIQDTADQLIKFESTGQRPQEAWDQCTVQLTQCAKAHVRAFIIKNFIDTINGASDDEPSLKRVLCLLFELYALCGILARSGSFLEDGYISKQQMHHIRQRVTQLLAELRPMAVQIVDAFEFKDRELMSVLGRYDGNVYENLYKWARESPLNRQEVLDGVKKYLIPMMDEARSKL